MRQTLKEIGKRLDESGPLSEEERDRLLVTLLWHIAMHLWGIEEKLEQLYH